MKVAILVPTFSHFSGPDRVAEQQAIEYSKKGHKVKVFCLEGDINPKKYSVDILGMPKSLLLQRIYRLLFFFDINKISSTAKKIKDYDLAISHLYPMNLIASKAKKKYGVKYVYYNHGVGYPRLFTSFHENIYMNLFGFFNKLSLKNTDEAVSISKFMQNELERETGLKSKVIYNRIDTKKFRKNLDGSGIRKKLNLDSKDKVLLFVGRLSPHKNVHSLIDIFNHAAKKIPNLKLVIVGKHTFPDYFEKLKMKSNKNIIFVESAKDDELPHYYAACDLYVTASLWEGFNLPIAEAQACGKKAVAFDVCSHPEIVKHGMLVRENDNSAFADAIVKVLGIN